MTTWFNRTPGSDVSESTETEEAALLIGDPTPDWVRLPADLGGAPARVHGHGTAPCPLCDSDTGVRHLHLEDGLGVAECSVHGFVWYRVKGAV